MFHVLANSMRSFPTRCSTIQLIGIRKSPVTFIRHRSDETFSLIGGGLEKLQGGLKEEQYFQNRNHELLVKWRQELKSMQMEGKLKDNERRSTEISGLSMDQGEDGVSEESSENSQPLSASEWNQLNQRLKSKMHRTVLQESCLLSKHKNCREELYFYDEQCDCTRRFRNQLLTDEKNQQKE